MPKRDTPPVFRLSLTNATVLSGLYLLVAAVVELTRRFSSARWVERASFALEVFPARTLDFLGLFEPMRRAWIEGRLSDGVVRLCYGATTVALIFALGLVVGVGMWVLVKLSARRNPNIDTDGR
jgi:hypothetical protein